jgi:hypothetical protein
MQKTNTSALKEKCTSCSGRLQPNQQRVLATCHVALGLRCLLMQFHGTFTNRSFCNKAVCIWIRGWIDRRTDTHILWFGRETIRGKYNSMTVVTRWLRMQSDPHTGGPNFLRQNHDLQTDDRWWIIFFDRAGACYVTRRRNPGSLHRDVTINTNSITRRNFSPLLCRDSTVMNAVSNPFVIS